MGESFGDPKGDSLNSRLDVAQSALDTFLKLSNIRDLFVAGFSMGGHVAARLLERNKNINGLILSSAAAYGRNSENKTFDIQFTNSIQVVNSWKNSPIFPILQKFKGKVLVIYGEHDKVIPGDVKTQYLTIGKAKGKSVVVKNGKHNLFAPVSETEKTNQIEVIKIIADFISSED